MSILDRLFGNAPAPQTQAPANPVSTAVPSNGATSTKQSISVPVVQLGGTNPLVPNPSNTPTQLNPDGTPQSDPPMSKFADVFTVKPNQAGTGQPSFSLDPDKFQQQVSQMDFATSALTPELSAKILAGGEDAIKALATVMNKVGQESFAKAAQFSAKTAEFGYTQSKESLTRDLPSQLRRQSAVNDLFEAHPGLRNPAAQPLVETMTERFTATYPNATPAEINGMVKEYFDGVGQLFTKQPTQQDARQKSIAAASDFSSFLS